MLPGKRNYNREWKIREEAETDWSYGERPEERSVEEKLRNGLVIVDKPDGPTSHQVSIWVKKILEQGKSGHSGTLDPNATGILPVALNRGTKVLQALTKAGKVYIGSMELEEELSKSRIAEEAEDYIGTVKQVPPEKSAVKREERKREIYDLDILEVKGTQILFRIECEKVFYVRVFCRSFAKELGTGGEMEDLRRVKVGGVFEEDSSWKLQEVKDEYMGWKEGDDNHLDEIILPIEAGIRHLKKVIVKDSAVASVCHGADLGCKGISKLQEGVEEGEMVAILTLKGELVALGEARMDSGAMLEDDGTGVELKRVFMDKEKYPKAWKQ